MADELTASMEGDVVVTADHAMTFDTFFLEEYAGVYGSLCLITRNCHEAEEIAQDAFIKMWERWDTVESIDDPVAYVHRVAMNTFRRRYRRARLAMRRTLRLTPADDLSRLSPTRSGGERRTGRPTVRRSSPRSMLVPPVETSSRSPRMVARCGSSRNCDCGSSVVPAGHVTAFASPTCRVKMACG